MSNLNRNFIIKMVGVAGFKPTTSPTPRVCAIRLRYTPNMAIIAKFLNVVVKNA